MANLKLKERETTLEVGDMITTDNISRIIIQGHNKFYTVDPKDMIIRGTFDTLEDIEKLYLYKPFKIIKAENLIIVEE